MITDMTTDTLIVIISLLASGLALGWGLRGGWRLAALIGAAALAAGTWIAAQRWSPPPSALAAYQPARVPDLAEDDPYVSSRTCRSCHPEAYETWRQTYHRTMTQRPSEATVIPEWSGTLEDRGRTYRLLRRGDEFWVDMPAYGTDGQRPEDRVERPIALLTGSHQMQIYWVPAPWADVPPTPGERRAYQLHCERCHVPVARQGLVAAPAADLTGLGLQPDELAGLWDLEPHQGAFDHISPRDRELALRHLSRGQLTGPLNQFPFSWFVREGRWVHEEYTFLQPPEDDPSGEPFGEDWSNRCDQCHSVSPRFSASALDPGGKGAVAELGIACEACHGPGRAHVERHQSPLSRYQGHFADEEDEGRDIVNPRDLSPERALAVCGQCHGELIYHGDWADPETPKYRPGDRLDLYANVLYYEADPAKRPQWLADALRSEPDLLQSAFWRDGTMRIAGRDLNGIVASTCAQDGELTCLSCHAMHDHQAPEDLLGREMDSDKACTQCHPAVAQDLAAHTHHDPKGSGSRCYNCHMPHTTFGLLKAIRAHRIDSPSAAISAESGRPTACNLCHLDKSLGEIADHLSSWYDQPRPALSADDEAVAQSVIHLLAGDAVQRGVMAWHMAWPPAQAVSDPRWFAPYLAQLVDDPYVAVRFLAIDALQSLPGYEDYDADFTDEGALKPAAEEALRRWQQQPAADLPPATLIGPDDLQRRLEIRRRRDDTPISINE